MKTEHRVQSTDRQCADRQGPNRLQMPRKGTDGQRIQGKNIAKHSKTQQNIWLFICFYTFYIGFYSFVQLCYSFLQFFISPFKETIQRYRNYIVPVKEECKDLYYLFDCCFFRFSPLIEGLGYFRLQIRNLRNKTGLVASSECLIEGV